MAYDSNDGVARLAAVLDARMRDHADKPLCLDFAEIQADGSLLSNTFPIPIPKSDYRVCRQLTLGKTGDAFCDVRADEHSGKAYLPESMRQLQAGNICLRSCGGNDWRVRHMRLDPDKQRQTAGSEMAETG